MWFFSFCFPILFHPLLKRKQILKYMRLPFQVLLCIIYSKVNVERNMQYLVSSIISTCTFSRSFILFFALICLISLYNSSVDAQSKAPASPEKEIVVKDFKWGS